MFSRQIVKSTVPSSLALLTGLVFASLLVTGLIAQALPAHDGANLKTGSEPISKEHRLIENTSKRAATTTSSLVKDDGERTPHGKPDMGRNAKETAPGAKRTEGEHRTLRFPNEYSIGALFTLFRQGPYGGYFTDKGPQLGFARGTVTLVVPKGRLLMLELNTNVFKHPGCLNEVSPQGIDCLRIGFMSMNDDESRSDEVLKYIPHFQKLVQIDLNRSDTTDAGLKYLKSQTALRCILAFLAPIHGSCFKELGQVKALSVLSLGCSPIEQKNLSYLSNFPMLQELRVSKVNLTEEGIKHLATCRSLRSLRIYGNKNVDDQSLKLLLPLKNLEELDVRSTEVTLRGIKALAPLKLQSLYITDKLFSEHDISEIRQIFPKIKLKIDRRGVSEDNKQLFAPLK
jgi:hypothetical protein